jgi:hypothetical protein
MIGIKDLSDLIYEPVNDEYGWGRYGYFKVLIRKKDGYINVTKLCQDGGKRFDNWLRLKEVDRFVNEFKSSPQNRGELLGTVMAGDYILRGTYAHPLLVPHIASWISTEFAFKVSRIVNDHMVRVFEEQMRQKDTKIDELLQEVKNVRGENSELFKQNKILSEKLDLANENIIEAVKGIGKANRNISGVQQKLNITADNHVPRNHLAPKDIETYVLFHCGCNEDGTSVYVQSRTRPYFLKKRPKNLISKYGSCREVFRISPVPNARALASEFERRIVESGAVFEQKYERIIIPADSALSETRLVEIAREVFEERMAPVEEAEAECAAIEVSIEQGKLRVVEEEEDEEEVAPTEEDRLTELLEKTMKELKELARAFPRSKAHGSWSGKCKADLAAWIVWREI